MEDRLRLSEEASPAARPSFRSQLADVRMPDVCIWIFIASLLFAFGGFGNKALHAVAVNAMNVTLVLFFFQGTAVTMRFFAKIRMGWFWQTVFMVLIVLHLFLFVSLVGLLDYWFDFRTRFAKPPEVGREEV
jgi:hypothetical protein